MRVEANGFESPEIRCRLVTRFAAAAADLCDFEEMAIVVKAQPDPGRDARTDDREFGVTAERRELMAAAAFAVVDAADERRDAAMIGVALHARDGLRRIGFRRIGTAKQHVRRLQQAIGSGWIVAALAAQIIHGVPDVVALRAAPIDWRVRRGDIAG